MHFDPEYTSAPIVDRCATQIVVVHKVENDWCPEHFDIHSAFLYEDYEYHKTVYIREMARSNGEHKHGNTAGVLVRNKYRNPSRSYCYIEGLINDMKKTAN